MFLRLAEAASSQGKIEEAADWQKRDRAAINDEQRSQLPMAFIRRALADSTAQGQAADRAALRSWWSREPGAAQREWVATFRPLVAKSHTLAQTVPLVDARARLAFVEQIDRRIDVFKGLYDALPAERAEIADMSFRLAQLHRSDRTAPAPVGPLIAQLDLDPRIQRDVKRLLDYQVNPSLGLRNMWMNLHATVASAPEQNAVTHDVWLTLTVFFNETGPTRNQYLAWIMKNNPQLGVLLVPTPGTRPTSPGCCATTRSWSRSALLSMGSSRGHFRAKGRRSSGPICHRVPSRRWWDVSREASCPARRGRAWIYRRTTPRRPTSCIARRSAGCKAS